MTLIHNFEDFENVVPLKNQNANEEKKEDKKNNQWIKTTFSWNQLDPRHRRNKEHFHTSIRTSI